MTLEQFWRRLAYLWVPFGFFWVVFVVRFLSPPSGNRLCCNLSLACPCKLDFILNIRAMIKKTKSVAKSYQQSSLNKYLAPWPSQPFLCTRSSLWARSGTFPYANSMMKYCWIKDPPALQMGYCFPLLQSLLELIYYHTTTMIPKWVVSGSWYYCVNSVVLKKSANII